MKKALLSLLALCSLNTYAVNTNYVASPTTKITEVGSFSEYGGGDVYVKVESSHEACLHGFWLRKSDPGFEANLSVVLAAYHSNKPVIAFGLQDELWKGSTGKFCRIYSIISK